MAGEMRAQGIDVIDLSVGEPDFDTPEFIKQYAWEGLEKGLTKYTATAGTADFRSAIVEFYANRFGADVKVAEVAAACGGKQALFNAACTILNPGDDVLIPKPYWVTFPEIVTFCRANSVFIETEETDFILTADQVAAAITDKTKLLIINSPSNPSGAAYTAAEWKALGAVLLKHPRIIIGTDDMYEKIYWGAEPFTSLLTVCPELYDRTVTINGVSKAYAMTGWRIGYCGGPAEIITAMGTIQGQSTSNASSISQRASVAALNGDQQCVAEMNKAFKERHDYIVKALNTLPGVTCAPASGAFYAFADVSGAIKALGLADDNAFASHLINTVGVAVVPGSGFGAPGHMRISFACSLKTLENAVERMRRALTA